MPQPATPESTSPRIMGDKSLIEGGTWYQGGLGRRWVGVGKEKVLSVRLLWWRDIVLDFEGLFYLDKCKFFCIFAV